MKKIIFTILFMLYVNPALSQDVSINGVDTEIYSKGMQTLDAEHAAIYEGKTFKVAGKFTVNSAASLDVLIITPSNIKYAHISSYEFDAEKAPCDIFEYNSGVVVSANGTAFTPTNINLLSSNTSRIAIYYGPTVTDTGTLHDYHLLSGSKQEGGSHSGFEGHVVMAPNSKYLVRLTNNSGQTSIIGFRLIWFEEK